MIPYLLTKRAMEKKMSPRFVICKAKNIDIREEGYVEPPLLKNVHGVHFAGRSNSNKSTNPRGGDAMLNRLKRKRKNMLGVKRRWKKGFKT